MRAWLPAALLALAPYLSAQTPSSAPAILRETQVAAPMAVGPATVPLNGPWAFHPGDDPARASPDFDDSAWPRLLAGKTWEEQGFRNLTGFGWYRQRITLTPLPIPQTNQPWKLALYLPAVQNAAEVYWNGRLIGSYGKLPPHPVWYDGVWPLGVAILCPTCGRGQFVLGPPQSGVLAIRVWTAPYVLFSPASVGGLATMPEIGSAEAIRDRVGRQSSVWLEGNLYGLGLALVSGIVALLALLAWLRDRRQWMLFWLGLYTAHAVLLLPWSVPGLLTFRWGYGLIAPVVCAEDVSLWFLLLYLLHLREDARLVRGTLWMAAVAVVSGFGDGALQIFQWTAWPHHRFLAWDIALTIPSLLVETWVLVLVAFAFRRRQDAARWLLAIAATLVDVVQAINDWGDAGTRWTHWTLGGLVTQPLFTIAGNRFTPATLADTLLLATILFAVWRYETEQRNRQILLDEEYRNAQEIQRVLVPESLPEVPGYAVSSAYRPAQIVGGDFFQIIPLFSADTRPASAANAPVLPHDECLIIVGDVSGKGLKSAMTVSLIVGAVRSLAEASTDPAEILAGLNRRLCGRLQNGFATCLALRISAGGVCVLANAGHLAPFINGAELDLPPALPLGLTPGSSFDCATLRLEPGDRITLYTDGLLEARKPTGELFGFDRLRELIASGPDADAAVQAAVRFGQEDDVTVLVLTRTAALPAPATKEDLAVIA